MKYFIPDWDDRVDPNYNFINDFHSLLHSENSRLNDIYMWDIFGVSNVPFNGLLVSRMTVSGNNPKYDLIKKKGIHEALRLPQSFEIMGDCGAFGYVDKDSPPFTSKETFEYYLRCGFNYGVTVDHMILPAFKSQNQDRWNITIENAREMFDIWQSSKDYLDSIRIIGVAQGWDTHSFKKSVKELLLIGYDYIALGGIARAPTGSKNYDTHDHVNNNKNSTVSYSVSNKNISNQTNQKADNGLNNGTTKTVYNIVQAAWQEISSWMSETGRKVDLHIFGVARPELMYNLINYGVSSFDSASYLRKAWLGGDKNYLTNDGNFYGAIRIPQLDKSSITRNIKEDDKILLRKLEANALEKLRGYDRGEYCLEDTIMTILQYDRCIGEKRNFEKYYRKTLEDKPWKNCPCEICKKIGVEVIMFRGNNRNRRRGFHNTFSFYSKFRKSSPRIFAFTFCTSTKDLSDKLLPAYLRYSASMNMKSFWKNVYDLPIEIGMFSAKYGVLYWSDRIHNYDYKISDDDMPRLFLDLKEKLKVYDKIFFIGLGKYKMLVEKIRDETGYNIEVFPKTEFAIYKGRKRPLDIIEYRKQLKFLRKAIEDFIPGYSPHPHSSTDTDKTFDNNIHNSSNNFATKLLARSPSVKEMSLDSFIDSKI